MNVYYKFCLTIFLIGILIRPQIGIAVESWFVSPNGNDNNDCISAYSPCATINGAITKSLSGDTILVSIGTYVSTTNLEVLAIDKDITLTGGWDSLFSTQNGESIIDGQGERRGIVIQNGTNVIIDRFIIQNGAGRTEGAGGIFISGGNLKLINSTVRNSSSHAGITGGGIGMNSGTLILDNTTVTGNMACGGGGIYSSGYGKVIINNSTVSGNISYGTCGGGGIYLLASTLNLTNSAVINNSSSIRGGGIFSDPPSAVTLTNTTISGNVAGWDGGGIYHTGNDSTVILNNATVTTNRAESGGGIYTGGGVNSSIILKNTIVAKNIASIFPDCRAPSVTPTESSGYNLIGNSTGCYFASTIRDM